MIGQNQFSVSFPDHRFKFSLKVNLSGRGLQLRIAATLDLPVDSCEIDVNRFEMVSLRCNCFTDVVRALLTSEYGRTCRCPISDFITSDRLEKN